jgi:hypothetical protein
MILFGIVRIEKSMFEGLFPDTGAAGKEGESTDD